MFNLEQSFKQGCDWLSAPILCIVNFQFALQCTCVFFFFIHEVMARKLEQLRIYTNLEIPF